MCARVSVRIATHTHTHTREGIDNKQKSNRQTNTHTGTQSNTIETRNEGKETPQHIQYKHATQRNATQNSTSVAIIT